MDVNLVLSPNPTLTGNWRLSAFAETNPTAEVAFLIIGGSHAVSQAVSLTNLDRIPHYIKLVHVASSQVLHDFSYRPMDTDYVIYTPLYHQIGDGQTTTPAMGDTIYRNPYLEGKDYWVERRGIGTMVENIEITKVNSTPNFGFDLILPGDSFGDEETFIIHFHPKKTLSPVNESVAGKWFENSIEITASRAYLITDLKKLLLLRGTGTTITYTLPSAANAPIGFVFGFQTMGSTWTNHVIASPSINIKDKTGTSVNSITIAANQYLYLMFNGTFWQIIAASDLLPFTISDNPDENLATKVASTVATKILADRIKLIDVGKFNIGNIGTGDQVFEIPFLNPNNYDYIVMGSWKSNGNHAKDNEQFWAWWKHETTPNTKFKIAVKENNSETQNVEFCWTVYRV